MRVALFILVVAGASGYHKAYNRKHWPERLEGTWVVYPTSYEVINYKAFRRTRGALNPYWLQDPRDQTKRITWKDWLRIRDSWSKHCYDVGGDHHSNIDTDAESWTFELAPMGNLTLVTSNNTAYEIGHGDPELTYESGYWRHRPAEGDDFLKIDYFWSSRKYGSQRVTAHIKNNMKRVNKGMTMTHMMYHDRPDPYHRGPIMAKHYCSQAQHIKST